MKSAFVSSKYMILPKPHTHLPASSLLKRLSTRFKILFMEIFWTFLQTQSVRSGNDVWWESLSLLQFIPKMLCQVEVRTSQVIPLQPHSSLFSVLVCRRWCRNRKGSFVNCSLKVGSRKLWLSWSWNSPLPGDILHFLWANSHTA